MSGVLAGAGGAADRDQPAGARRSPSRPAGRGERRRPADPRRAHLVRPRLPAPLPAARLHPRRRHQSRSVHDPIGSTAVAGSFVGRAIVAIRAFVPPICNSRRTGFAPELGIFRIRWLMLNLLQKNTRIAPF